MSPEDQRSYVVSKARSGQLQTNDPHWQSVNRRAGQGVTADQNTQEQVAELGGANRGNVNKVI